MNDEEPGRRIRARDTIAEDVSSHQKEVRAMTNLICPQSSQGFLTTDERLPCFNSRRSIKRGSIFTMAPQRDKHKNWLQGTPAPAWEDDNWCAPSIASEPKTASMHLNTCRHSTKPETAS